MAKASTVGHTAERLAKGNGLGTKTTARNLYCSTYM